MTADELAAVVLDQAEREGIDVVDLLLAIADAAQPSDPGDLLLTATMARPEKIATYSNPQPLPAITLTGLNDVVRAIGNTDINTATGHDLTVLAAMSGEPRHLETDDELREPDRPGP